MTPKIKSSQHLEEQELNKLLRYLQKNELWTYYVLVRLGVSTALRHSDLSRITWEDVLGKTMLVVREKKTKKVREIPIHVDLQNNLSLIYEKLGSPDPESPIIPISIRGVNKQIKVYAHRAGIKGKRISTHTFRKTFGREVWRRNNYSEPALIRLSYLFNHSSVSTTRIYLDITREEVDNMYDIQDLFVY